LSVADSSASTAVLIQNRIREMVAAGYDKDAIETYFVSKYGEWVLLSPTSDGLNRIVWIGPALAFVLGLMAATTFLRRGAESLEEAAAAPSPLPDDPYAAELLAEVDDE
jgi:cytochrome c-type biogenesis protein CcmH